MGENLPLMDLDRPKFLGCSHNLTLSFSRKDQVAMKILKIELISLPLKVRS